MNEKEKNKKYTLNIQINISNERKCMYLENILIQIP